MLVDPPVAFARDPTDNPAVHPDDDANAPAPVTLALTPGGTARALAACAALLALAALVAGVLRFRFGIEHGPLNFIPLFDLDNEASIPTWFSAVLLLACAALLGVIGRIARVRRAPFAWHWLGLALLFVILSIDESISLHERTMHTMRKLLRPTGFLYFGWVVPGAVAVIVIGLAYLRFVVRLPRRTRARVVLAGAVYLAGVMGVEMIGASYAWHHNVGMGVTDVPYAFITGLEEMVEITGLILFVHALLDHLSRETGGRITLALTKLPRPARPPAPHPDTSRTDALA